MISLSTLLAVDPPPPPRAPTMRDHMVSVRLHGTHADPRTLTSEQVLEDLMAVLFSDDPSPPAMTLEQVRQIWVPHSTVTAGGPTVSSDGTS